MLLRRHFHILYLIVRRHKWLPPNQPLYIPSHLIFTQHPPQTRSYLCLCLLCSFLLSLFKKKTSRKRKNPLTHTLVWTNTQCPVSKGFTSAAAAAASALYRQSPANTIRLIWQAKENQTASQYTKEVRAAGALNREALHSLWPSFTAQGGLDRGGGGGGYLGNNRYTIEEEKEMRGGGGRERGFRRIGWNRIGLFKLCLYVQHVSKKNTSENHQSPRDQSFTLLDALFRQDRCSSVLSCV